VVSRRRLTELCKDSEVADLLFNYPTSLQKLIRRIRRDFVYLAKLREFRHDADASTPDVVMFGFIKLLEEMTDV
jgi:hypothetical protein